MSSLLRDAIVDAKALREAALKNAETSVIDKYSEEVRETLNRILEQDELEVPDLGAPEGDPAGAGAEADLGGGLDLGGDLGGDLGAPPEEAAAQPAEVVAADIPLAATDNLSENDGTNLSKLPHAGEEIDVEINLDALQEAVQDLRDNQEIDLSMHELTAFLSEGSGSDSGQALAGSAAATAASTNALENEEDEDEKGPEDPGSFAGEETGLGEEIEISEELINDLVERLVVDMGAALSGWAGRPAYDIEWQMKKAFAQRRSTDLAKDMEILKKAKEELVFENKQLSETLTQYKQATEELRENLQDVNLSNARLLYTNRVLRNTSLNERQKEKIAGAISKAGSVMEAKTIHQTLESTVESTPNRGPQSLNEAIGRRSTSIIRASRKESTSSDPLADRMKRLAGIK